MNWKRGVLTGLGIYAASIIWGFLLIFSSTSIDLNNPIVLVVSLIILAVIYALFSLWYFRKEIADWKEGLYLGLILLATVLVIELLLDAIDILTNVATFSEAIGYYTSWQFLVRGGSIVLISILVGYWKSKKVVRKRK